MGWLILCATLAQANPSVDIFKAPPLLKELQGLPAPIEHDDGAVTLPADLAGAVDKRLLAYSVYPRQCQTRIDAVRSVHGVALADGIRAARLQGRADVAAVVIDRPSVLRSVLIPVGILVLGIAMGSAGERWIWGTP